MDHAIDVLRTHPHLPADLDAIVSCLRSSAECAVACTGCADACLAEDMVAELRPCIRANLDCATISAATTTVLSRLGGMSEVVVRAQLAACIAICRECGDLCAGHAGMHAHCAACALSCRACQQACSDLLKAMH